MERKYRIRVALVLAVVAVQVEVTLLPQRPWSLPLKFALLVAILLLALDMRRLRAQSPVSDAVRTDEVKRHYRLIAGGVLIALAFAWFIPALSLVPKWVPNPDISNQVIIWPFLMLAGGGSFFVSPAITRLFRRDHPGR